MSPADAHRVARRFALVRLGPGDYVLPSNDFSPAGGVLWRFYRYQEDGSAVSGAWPNEVQIFGEFWGTMYVAHRTLIAAGLLSARGYLDVVGLRDPEGWEWIDFARMHRSRREAIAYALDHDPLQRDRSDG